MRSPLLINGYFINHDPKMRLAKRGGVCRTRRVGTASWLPAVSVGYRGCSHTGLPPIPIAHRATPGPKGGHKCEPVPKRKPVNKHWFLAHFLVHHDDGVCVEVLLFCLLGKHAMTKFTVSMDGRGHPTLPAWP